MTNTEKYDIIHDECEMDEMFAGEGTEKVAECQYCGKDIAAWDEATAVVSADGRDIACYCVYCMYQHKRFVEDLCEAAGLWYQTGWADETIAAADHQARIQREAKVPAKRIIVIQKGVRA